MEYIPTNVSKMRLNTQNSNLHDEIGIKDDLFDEDLFLKTQDTISLKNSSLNSFKRSIRKKQFNDKEELKLFSKVA